MKAFIFIALTLFGTVLGNSRKPLPLTKSKSAKTTTVTPKVSVQPNQVISHERTEEEIEMQEKCEAKHYKSILHGKALVSSVHFDRESAEECCQYQYGFNSLLSLDDDYRSSLFANSHKVKFHEPYHVFTKQDASGNYLYAQGDRIPRELMSKDAYSPLLKPGNCLFAVIESSEGERVTRYVTGACQCLRPFICMRLGPEENFNITCNAAKYYDSLESGRQNPSEVQKFDLTEQNRHLAKASLKADINGWSAPVVHPLLAYRLVARTFEVYREVVPVDVLPAGFTTKAMILFAEINGRHGPDSKADFLTEEDFTRIDSILTKCAKKLPKIPYVYNDCKTLILGTLDNVTVNYVCPKPGFSYNQFSSDPVLHVAQNVFQTTRNLCFPTFKENTIKLFHRWQLAINDCFAKALKDRWDYQIENMDYWNKMLGVHFEEKVRMTDAVAMAVIDKSEPWSMTYPRGAPPNLRLSGI